ncbi:merozoite adhesive erythrocytic binding protein [Plasmodium sp. gorilla clade G2]|uniref:merozoite adhesive erythrocytic binding protein n=1 Tax=Plasmodium sp. gorilla clade G2 TaxID=880535 RepID=UPI000D223B69|nr:merozoite adhesive erythrocytic binding protein [Plasmodium sp. gorilla clade G2]SOV16146.1 merozoite adhesive erythrocytic binding protein [Plasmodium sp. gorilla clade G2]
MGVLNHFFFLLFLYINSTSAFNNPQEEFMDRFDINKNHVNIKWSKYGIHGNGKFKYEIGERDIISKGNESEKLTICPNHIKEGTYKLGCPDYGKTFLMGFEDKKYSEEFLNEISFGFLNKKYNLPIEIPLNKSGLSMYQGLFKHCPYNKKHYSMIKKENGYDMCFRKFYNNSNISTRIYKRGKQKRKIIYFSSHGLGGRLGANIEEPLHKYDYDEHYVTKKMRYPENIKNLFDCSIYSHCIGPCLYKDFNNRCFLNLPVLFNHQTNECVIIGTHEERRIHNCQSESTDKTIQRCFHPVKKEKGNQWTYASSFIRTDYMTKCPPRFPLNHTMFGYFNYSTGECETDYRNYEKRTLSFSKCIEKLFNNIKKQDDMNNSSFLWGVWNMENKTNEKTILTSMNNTGSCYFLKTKPTCVVEKENHFSFTILTANSFNLDKNIIYPKIKNNSSNLDASLINFKNPEQTNKRVLYENNKKSKRNVRTNMNPVNAFTIPSNLDTKEKEEYNMKEVKNYPNNNVSYIQKVHSSFIKNRFKLNSDSSFKPIHQMIQMNISTDNKLYDYNNQKSKDSNKNMNGISVTERNPFMRENQNINPQRNYMERFDIPNNHIFIEWQKEGEYGKDEFKYNIISNKTAGTSQSLFYNYKDKKCPNHVYEGRAHGSCPNYGKAIIVQNLQGEEYDKNFNLNFLNEIRTGYLNKYFKNDVEISYEDSGIAMHNNMLSTCPVHENEEKLFSEKTDYNYNMCKSRIFSNRFTMKEYDPKTQLFMYYGLYGLGGRLGANIKRDKQKDKKYQDNITLPMKNPSLIKNLFDCSIYSYCLGPCLENSFGNKCFRNLPAYYNHSTNECVILGTHEQERSSSCRRTIEEKKKPNCQILRKTNDSKDWTYVSSFIRPDYETKCPPRFPLKSKVFGTFDRKTGKCKSLLDEAYVVGINNFSECLEYLFLTSPKDLYNSQRNKYWGIWAAEHSVNENNIDIANGKCYHLVIKPTCIIDKENHFSFTALTANTVDFNQTINIRKIEELTDYGNKDDKLKEKEINNKPIDNVKQPKDNRKSHVNSMGKNKPSYNENDDKENEYESMEKNLEDEINSEESGLFEEARRAGVRKNVENDNKNEKDKLDEIKKEKQLKEEEEARKVETRRREDESKKKEDTRRYEDERRIEAARRYDDAKRIEAARRYEDERRIEAARRYDDAKRIEAARRYEDERRIEEAKRAEEIRKAEDLRKEEEVRKAEEIRKFEEARMAHFARRQAAIKAEEKKRDDELKKAEEKKRDDELKKAEEARKAIKERNAEEIRKFEEARMAHFARRQDAIKAEAKRKADELKKAEEKRKADELKKAEAKKKADELKKVEAKKKADELKKAEERKKADELKKSEERKKAEEKKREEERRNNMQLRRAEILKQIQKKRIEDVMKLYEEEKKAEQLKKEEEEKKKAEQLKKEEEEKRKAEQLKIEEEKRKAEKLKKEEEEKKKAEQRKKDEEEKIIKAEQLKKEEEEKRKTEQLKAEEEKKRKIEELKAEEEKIIKAEQLKKEEEEKRKAEQLKIEEEEKRKAEQLRKEEEKKAEDLRKEKEAVIEEELRKEDEKRRMEVEKKYIDTKEDNFENIKESNRKNTPNINKEIFGSEIKEIVITKNMQLKEEDSFEKHNSENSKNSNKNVDYPKEKDLSEDDIGNVLETYENQKINKDDTEGSNNSIAGNNNDINYTKLDVEEYKKRDVKETREKIIKISKTNMCNNDFSSKYCDYMKDSISSGTCSNEERKNLCCSISDFCLQYFDHNSNKYYDCTKKEFADPLYRCFKKKEFSNMVYFAGAGIVLILLFVIGSKIIIGKWFEEATFDEMDLNYDKIYTLAMINNEETEVNNPLNYSAENTIK